MRIVFELPVIYEPITKSIAGLTNLAEICVDDIRYDQSIGIIDIPLKRREWIWQEGKGCLGLVWLRPTYKLSQNWIESVLTIRQVATMMMDVDDILVHQCTSRFSAMMGLTMRDDQLYLDLPKRPAERPFRTIRVAVKGIDVELADRT